MARYPKIDHAKQSLSQHHLKSAKRVLYMTHLALGDYLYQGPLLKELAHTYPNMILDVWFDDLRAKPKSWHQGRNDALNQWLLQEPHINAIYPNAPSTQARTALTLQAQNQQYDVIVILATTRSHHYVKLARRIAPNAHIVALGDSNPSFLKSLFYFRHADYVIAPPSTNEYSHISEFYSLILTRLCHTKTPNSAIATFNHTHLENQKIQVLLQSLCAPKQRTNTPKVMINHLSTNEKRDLASDKLHQLITHFSQNGALVIVNAAPTHVAPLKAWLEEEKLSAKAHIFCAEKDFFELPALIANMDLVVSVETAIMHFAASLERPLVALIRESAWRWRPLAKNQCTILQAQKRVNDIQVQDIINAADALITYQNTRTASLA